jgi:hypothetical protein
MPGSHYRCPRNSARAAFQPFLITRRCGRVAVAATTTDSVVGADRPERREGAVREFLAAKQYAERRLARLELAV